MPGGGRRNSPLRFFLHNSKTPWDIGKKISDLNFTPLTVILHILSITIVIRCCHSNLLFSVCHIIFGVENNKETWNLNYFQDDYLIKLKFGKRGLLLSPEFKLIKIFMYDVILTSQWRNVKMPLYQRLKKFIESLWRHFLTKTLEILHKDFS